MRGANALIDDASSGSMHACRAARARTSAVRARGCAWVGCAGDSRTGRWEGARAGA